MRSTLGTVWSLLVSLIFVLNLITDQELSWLLTQCALLSLPLSQHLMTASLTASLLTQLPADFFATWCSGCQRSYPELCKIAMDPDMQKEVKFVKVRQLHSRPCPLTDISWATPTAYTAKHEAEV